jgi:diguanylate cyclase (GGDEF)-like protein
MSERRRTHLRSRVFVLTGFFSLVLFAITFGLSWRARVAQERWQQLVGIETRAIYSLEELIRAQNAYRNRFAEEAANGTLAPQSAQRYRSVSQLLLAEALIPVDLPVVRARVRSFQAIAIDTVLQWPASDPAARSALLSELTAASDGVSREAQVVVDSHKRSIAEQLPILERETRDLMITGLAVAWIVAIFSFAVARLTLAKVVRPLEDLSTAADRIAAGDLSARAPVRGDREIARLGTAFNRMAEALAASHSQLQQRARTDELTRLPNFRAFRERLDEEVERANRYEQGFGVLVLDLDRFKKYNDTYGHLAGNSALQRVAASIRETVRAVDFPARYGGEEFAVILPLADPDALAAVAERIRNGVETIPAPPEGSTITVSIGGAIYPEDAVTLDELFRVADARLYVAKENGRNRFVGATAVAAAM